MGGRGTGDNVEYLKSKEYCANIWAYNIRNASLNKKYIRSRALKTKQNYPRTCYSPRNGISYDEKALTK
jgi:hypothetical protein